MRIHFIAAWMMAMGVVAAPVLACPLCDSGTGQAVRAGLFDADFGRNLVVLLLPFPILLGIVTLQYFGLPKRRFPSAPGGRSRGHQPW